MGSFSYVEVVCFLQQLGFKLVGAVFWLADQIFIEEAVFTSIEAEFAVVDTSTLWESRTSFGEADLYSHSYLELVTGQIK
jgi:hypothetical protein